MPIKTKPTGKSNYDFSKGSKVYELEIINERKGNKFSFYKAPIKNKYSSHPQLY